MGNYEEDRAEYRRRLGKSFTDGQYADFAETLWEAAPDVATATLAGPAIVAASTAGGIVIGGGVGAALGGPPGMLVGGLSGGAGGAYLGVQIADSFSESYRSASTADRARTRDLGAKGGVVVAAVWKMSRFAFG